MYRKKILVTLCAGLLTVSICLGSVFQLANAVPSYGSDVRVDSNTSDQELPSIAIYDPGCAGCQPIIHAVWEDYRNGNWDIYYKRSEDGGKTFGNLLRVNDDTSGTQYPQRHPDIAVDYDGNAHVVWSDERNPLWTDKTQIYYAKLAFGASSFSTNIMVSDDGRIPPIYDGNLMYKAEPSIVTDFQSTCRVPVSWYLYEANGISSIIHGVFYDRNTNCGSGSFGTDLRLNQDGYYPDIAIDSSDNPHIAYVNYSIKVNHVKSSNGGSSFGCPTAVTDAQSTLAHEPTIAIYPDPSDGIHVAWKDERNLVSNNNYDIYYAKSTNGGTSFGSNVNVISGDLNNRGQGMPSIGVDELGNPHVVWTDYRNDADGWWVSGGGFDNKNDADIYYAESTNGGTSFSTNRRVNDDSPVSGYDKEQSYPAVAVTGGIATSEMVHVVWMDERNTNFDIYYSRYVPDQDIHYRKGSWDWQPETEISTDSGTEEQDCYTPGFAIAADGDDVHIVWRDEGDGDEDIYYRHYDGSSWQSEYEVSTDSGTEDQKIAAVAVDGDDVHIVWEDEGGSATHIYHRHYDGSSWQTEEKVSQGGIANWYPAVAVDGDDVHVVWSSFRDNTDHDIYYRHYDGSSWGTEQEISSDSGTEPQSQPSIAVNGDKVHVVWSDAGDGDVDIYYRYFDGSSWQTEVEISTDSGTEDQWDPSIAVDGAKIHVIWVDRGDGDPDIYYRCYDGSSWQTEMEVSTDSGTEEQYSPEIAVGNSRPYIVWEDWQS